MIHLSLWIFIGSSLLHFSFFKQNTPPAAWILRGNPLRRKLLGKIHPNHHRARPRRRWRHRPAGFPTHNQA